MVGLRGFGFCFALINGDAVLGGSSVHNNRADGFKGRSGMVAAPDTAANGGAAGAVSHGFMELMENGGFAVAFGAAGHDDGKMAGGDGFGVAGRVAVIDGFDKVAAVFQAETNGGRGRRRWEERR